MSDVSDVVSVAVVNEEGEHFKETVVEHLPGIDSLPVGTELVDRAHVTRMQAEVERLSECLERSQADLARMTEGRDGLRSTLDEANKVIAWQRDEKPDLAEIEKLRRDAERYRYLRTKGLSLEGHDFISFDEIADYRIDVAMGKGGR